MTVYRLSEVERFRRLRPINYKDEGNVYTTEYSEQNW